MPAEEVAPSPSPPSKGTGTGHWLTAHPEPFGERSPPSPCSLPFGAGLWPAARHLMEQPKRHFQLFLPYGSFQSKQTNEKKKIIKMFESLALLIYDHLGCPFSSGIR